MASPIVTNAGADLNGKTLLLAETSASVSGGLIPASDDVQIGVLRKKTISLTHAQILTLPTTFVEIVAAPGSTHYLVVHRWAMTINTAAGAYTNVDLTDAANGITVAYGDWIDDASTFVALWDFGQVRAVSILLGGPYVAVPDAAALSGVYPPYGAGPNGIQAVNNLPLKLVVWNNSAGNLTGGNVANSGKITVYYSIEAL